MSLLGFVLGALIILLIWSMKSWISKNQIKLSWLSWIGIVITTILGFFAIAWSISSIIEGENQAAGIGLLIFGGLTFILFGLTRKKILRDIRVKPNKK